MIEQVKFLPEKYAPIVLTCFTADARYWQRRHPEWRVISFLDPLCGYRADRVVLQEPHPVQKTSDYIRELYRRAAERAPCLLRPGGRLMFVDYRGIPQKIFRAR